MAVKGAKRPQHSMLNRDGQSAIETLFFLPVFFGFVAVVMKVNSAIQISIVHQKYARAQAMYLTHNSPTYPELRFRDTESFDEMTQLNIGVSENIVKSDRHRAEAPVQPITRYDQLAEAIGDPEQSLPRQRAKIRVRSVVTLCMPPKNPTDFNYCGGPIEL